MKCKKQYNFHKLEISNIWEIRLDNGLWERIRAARKNRNCTLSWITRYCVFRLMRRHPLKMTSAMEKLSNCLNLIPKDKNKMHRHMLCLYGDDEKLIRLAAMNLNITVSHFIRLAIYKFLPDIERFRVTWHHIYYHGTKICRYIDLTVQNKYQLHFTCHMFFTKWPKENWWRRPRYQLPMPFTP